PKFCDVCSEVPAWLNSLSWDKTTDTWNDPVITLRSWNDMQAEAKNSGCDLCKMIVGIVRQRYQYDISRLDDSSVNTPLTFWREVDYQRSRYLWYATDKQDLFIHGAVCSVPSEWC